MAVSKNAPLNRTVVAMAGKICLWDTNIISFDVTQLLRVIRFKRKE